MSPEYRKWQKLKTNYLKQVQQSLASVNHPKSTDILHDIEDHLEQKYRDLKTEHKNWEGCQQILIEMGPPDEYAELLAEETIRTKKRQLGLNKSLAILFIAAFLVIGAYLVYINSAGFSTPAFADAVGPLLNAKTVSFRSSGYMQIGDTETTFPTSLCTYQAPSYMRIETPEDNEIVILDMQSDKILTLMLLPNEKTAMKMEMPIPSIRDITPEDIHTCFFDIREEIRRAKENGTAELLPETVMDRRKVIGYRICKTHNDVNSETTLWIDKKTFLPVKTQSTMTFGSCTFSHEETDFEFDKAISPDLFSMDVPEGYTLVKPTIDFAALAKTSDEKALIEMFRLWTQYAEGRFPPELTLESITDLTTVSMDRLTKELIEAPLTDHSNPNEFENNFNSLMNLSGQMVSGIVFVQTLPEESDWHYAGKDAVFGDAETAIFWYRPKNASTYRVIYADLSIKEVPATQKPVETVKPPAPATKELPSIEPAPTEEQKTLSETPGTETPSVLGKWVAIDCVKTIASFTPRQRQCTKTLMLKELDFTSSGTLYWRFQNNTVKQTPFGEFTAESITGRPANYSIKTINGQAFLFFEWITPQVIQQSKMPSYYVFTRLMSDSETESLSPAGLNHQNVLGKWMSVDFVRSIEDFKPNRQNFKGSLYLTGLEFQNTGSVWWLFSDDNRVRYSWSNGQVQINPSRPAFYYIKEMDGAAYLFFEWINGDVTIRGQQPAYYVLRKVWSPPVEKQLFQAIAKSPVKITFGLNHNTARRIKSLFGSPGRIDADGRILRYPDKSIDFVFSQNGPLSELHLNKGYQGQLSTGISLNSSKQDVFSTYGQPIRTIQAADLHRKNDKRILYQKGSASRIFYGRHGLVFWFVDNTINQIVVFDGTIVIHQ